MQFTGRTVFSTNDTRTIGYPYAKKKKKKANLETSFTKVNWIIALNVKCKTVKVLEYNTGENLGDLDFGELH